MAALGNAPEDPTLTGRLSSAEGPVPVRLSATVLVVRPAESADGGLQVLLLRRNDRSGFVAGATLYPGGAVDPGDALVPTTADAPGVVADSLPDVHRSGFGEDDPTLVRRLSVIAAARECFEEAGVLLAIRADGGWADAAQVSRVAAAGSFAAALHTEQLHVPVERFLPWGRWVTPVGAPRRYDTHFFVVAAPVGAEVRVDGREIVHGAWWNPGEALAAERAGELRFVTPTRKTLERLSEHRSFETVRPYGDNT